jgi:hypothetical protein
MVPVKSMEENQSRPKLMKICFYGIATSLSTMANSVFSNYFKVCRRHFVLDVSPQVVSKHVACFYNTTGPVDGNIFSSLSMLSHECTVCIIFAMLRVEYHNITTLLYVSSSTSSTHTRCVCIITALPPCCTSPPPPPPQTHVCA